MSKKKINSIAKQVIEREIQSLKLLKKKYK